MSKPVKSVLRWLVGLIVFCLGVQSGRITRTGANRTEVIYYMVVDESTGSLLDLNGTREREKRPDIDYIVVRDIDMKVLYKV